MPALEEVLRYLLDYDTAYRLGVAQRIAQVEREGKIVVSDRAHHRTAQPTQPSLVEIFDVATRRVLWRGHEHDWPENDAWEHLDNLQWEQHAEQAPFGLAGLPASLLQVLDEWVSRHRAEARHVLDEGNVSLSRSSDPAE